MIRKIEEIGEEIGYALHECGIEDADSKLNIFINYYVTMGSRLTRFVDAYGDAFIFINESSVELEVIGNNEDMPLGKLIAYDERIVFEVFGEEELVVEIASSDDLITAINYINKLLNE